MKKTTSESIQDLLDKLQDPENIDKNQNANSLITLYPPNSRKGVSKDRIISAYVAEGLDADELSKRYKLHIDTVNSLITQERLPELRKAYIQKGLESLQSKQLQQANDILQIENSFKSLRILQLREQLDEYLAYFARFGDLKKRHPETGDVLVDNDGMAMTLKLPNVSKEVRDLKESVTVSEGMRALLGQIEKLISSGHVVEQNEMHDTIDVTDYKELFERDSE